MHGVAQDAVVLQHEVELIGGAVELSSYDNLLLVSPGPRSPVPSPVGLSQVRLCGHMASSLNVERSRH